MKKNIFLVLLSLVLLVVPWSGLTGWTLLAALVPMLCLSEGYRSRRDFWRTAGWAALTFGAWAAATSWWIWYAAPIGAIASVIIQIVLFGGAFMLYHFVSKRAPRALAYTLLVSCWIALEYFYANGELSFPWLTLGNGFANDIPLIQWYDTTGVYGGSLWVLAANLVIYEALRRRSGKMWGAAALFVVLPAAISLVKYFSYEEKGEPVEITVVQPNFDPYAEKFILDADQQTDIMLDLSAQAPADADYIVLPETVLDEQIEERGISNSGYVERFRDLVREKVPGAQVIVGATTIHIYRPGERLSATARNAPGSDLRYDVYNSSLAIDTTDRVQIYHKSMLVVGAEKMPYTKLLKPLFALIRDLGGTTGQLGVDSVRRVFDGPRGIEAGAAICWEGVFGDFYGGFVRQGAELMFIISNDGWWGDTQAYRQLFRYARLRAVETRRAIARSANTGRSGFIDQRGDVLESVGWDRRAAITATLATNDKITFYTAHGDYIARICIWTTGLSLLGFVVYRIMGRRKYNR